ncbi:MAG: alpha/beta fold hydrolase [Acidihalobacter sp.]|jgi:alpha-beta hydrolase superfamily lysophospholipase
MTAEPLPRPETVRFDNARGQSLAGVLHRPAGEVRAHVVFVACFTCSKDIPVAVRIARALARHGFAALRFDLTGLGESGGSFTETDFESEVDDVLRAAAWLEANAEAPRLLIGHSLGGAAVLEAAARLPEVRAVTTIGTPATLDHIAELLHGETEERLPDGALVATIGGQRFTFATHFLDTLARHSPTQAAARLGRAYLVMHAPHDSVVPYAQARMLFDAAAEPRAFVSLDDADHLLRRQADVDYCVDLISAWAARPLAAARTRR